MLLSALQMLLLLGFLLCTPKLGLPSPLNVGNIKTSPPHEDRPFLPSTALDKLTGETTERIIQTNGDIYEEVVTLVRMVDINNEIYEQFKKSWSSVYMVFKKTELREAVPEPSLLSRAELHLRRRNEHQGQILLLFERHRSKSWHYLSYRILAQNSTSNWLWFDVSEAVQQWLNQQDEDCGPIEVFRLRTILLGEEEEIDLHMDISGLTPDGLSDHPDNDIRNRPFLLFLNTRLKQDQPVSSSQQP